MTVTMTSRERLLAACRGQSVDRVPIWLREGFPIAEPYPAPDDFSHGWMYDPVYRALFEDISPHADAIRGWGIGGWGNRYLMVPPERIHATDTQVCADIIRTEGYIDTHRGKLSFISERRRNYATSWLVKPPVECLADLVALAEVPFDVKPSDMAPHVDKCRQVAAEVGDRGIIRLFMSSPIVCVSHCLPFELFLELSAREKRFYHEILHEVTRRGLAIIDAIFKDRPLDTTIAFGGSEQCTPPMMSPRSFDEFVVPYEGALVARCKEYGLITSCHCHGKISHALQCIRDMGFDATDPVEPPPAGDVTYAQAREIARGKVTLIGNIEWDRLCFARPEAIRQQVREILALGNDRLILSTSAGPISQITPQIADNYRALVEAAVEYRG